MDKFLKENYSKNILNIVLNIVIMWLFFNPFNKDVRYLILYYLNENEEEKAIELLSSNFRILLTILKGDSNLVDQSVSMILLKVQVENIKFILNNYELSEKSKNILRNILSEKIKNVYLDNSLKIKHNINYYNFEKEFKKDEELQKNIDISELAFLGKELYLNIIKNKGFVDEDFKGKIKKLKNEYLKNLIENSFYDYTSMYGNIIELEKLKNETLDKLNK